MGIRQRVGGIQNYLLAVTGSLSLSGSIILGEKNSILVLQLGLMN